MKITITKLGDAEALRLTGSSRFNRLHPIRCQACGSTGPFLRHLFRIVGVRKSQQADDDVQGLLRLHLSQRHGAERAFLKSHGAGFYADSARCSQCGSSEIVFDIELTDELLSTIAEMTGRSPPEIKKGIEQAHRAILKVNAGETPDEPFLDK